MAIHKGELSYKDMQNDTDAFTKLLGLPKISLFNLFEMQYENDDLILDIMAENSHFIATLEGYPVQLTGKPELDFYSDSMTFVNRLTGSLSACLLELFASLKPHNSIMQTVMETELLKHSLKEFRLT